MTINSTHICPTCHGESARLVYCEFSRQMLCTESCALTEADMFFFELLDFGNSGQAAS